jgi:Recombination enhancement, RecA-dependent nuclease
MTPTAYSRRCQRIAEIGCLACRRRGWYQAPDVHHFNLDGKAGQKRLGNESTVGLCPYHHRGQPFYGKTLAWCRRVVGPSLFHESTEFREEFGTDSELLAEQNRLIDEAESNVVGRRIA